MPLLLVVLIITLLIGGFVDIKWYRCCAIALVTVPFVCAIGISLELVREGEAKLGNATYVLIAGIIFAANSGKGYHKPEKYIHSAYEEGAM